ncbi:hypothetical protein I553_6524 [Mycobacterium xenopi 4042]|uniref:Uncharacterized protein n=1 Tax=Mycobacterium xenopi 4042 TaxID=1299334 RepID=X8BFL3_MYCXE|nr:hypothetical protein I553_6524 [Mycobacterium xenopi 4042]
MAFVRADASPSEVLAPAIVALNAAPVNPDAVECCNLTGPPP